jgi:hypothetical protein
MLREGMAVNWEECGVGWGGPILFLCWFIGGTFYEHEDCIMSNESVMMNGELGRTCN